MLTISHRGCCLNAPENTLKAFEHAYRLGVDGIETDVRLTADSRLVLFHDRRLGNGQRVCDLSHSKLTDVAGYPVPRLEEALDWSDQKLWVLELKDPNATDQLVAILKRYVASHRLLVISFCHNAMVKVRQQLDVECGVSIAHRPQSLSMTELRQWHTIIWRYEFIDAELMQEAKVAKHRNFVFHVDGVDEHRMCREMGVDGVITDQPQLASDC